ncbi:MAG TPA: hypothetical protein PLL10_09360, partial [Elusimicrobiales bacterium]|nr:hypothetical protein [Elusimicrobiales bacterium]
MLFKKLKKVMEVFAVAGKPVQLVNNNAVNLAFGALGGNDLEAAGERDAFAAELVIELIFSGARARLHVQ